jgi:hypothetical protein
LRSDIGVLFRKERRRIAHGERRGQLVHRQTLFDGFELPGLGASGELARRRVNAESQHTGEENQGYDSHE